MGETVDKTHDDDDDDGGGGDGHYNDVVGRRCVCQALPSSVYPFLPLPPETYYTCSFIFCKSLHTSSFTWLTGFCNRAHACTHSNGIARALPGQILNMNGSQQSISFISPLCLKYRFESSGLTSHWGDGQIFMGIDPPDQKNITEATRKGS